MRAKISTTKVCIDNSVILNENEYNVHEIEFEFSEEYTNDLTKVALFTGKSDTYKLIITENKCSIPPEILTEQGDVILGVYAYKVENDELNIRYSPSPTSFFVSNGSFIADENTSNSEPLTPTDKEQIEQAITDLQNDISDLDTNKQDALVSGENIKTLNSESLLGEGNIDLNDIYYTEQEIDTKVSSINNAISNVENEIPSKISELTDDVGLVTTDVDNLENYTKTSDLSAVALSGDFNDLSNKPDTSTYSIITETGSKIELEINSSNYQLTAKLYDKNNNLISTSSSIDLPIESMVVNATYSNGIITLTLQNGNTLNVDISDIVSGLVKPEDLTDYVKNTDYATTNVAGVVKVNSYSSNIDSSGKIRAASRDYSYYINTMDNYHFISKGTLENVITGKGLVSNTDFATSSKVGVIRTSGDVGTQGNTTTGVISAATKTYEQYQSALNNLFIGKGTLENVLNEKIGSIETILEELDVGGGVQ